MDNYSVFFPGYSAGEDAYKEITTVCSPYGKKAVVISDEISINATKKYLDEAIAGTDFSIEYVLFPGESAFEYAEELQQQDVVKNADMIFCLGGGKAIDTGKLVAHNLKNLTSHSLQSLPHAHVTPHWVSTIIRTMYSVHSSV